MPLNIFYVWAVTGAFMYIIILDSHRSVCKVDSVISKLQVNICLLRTSSVNLLMVTELVRSLVYSLFQAFLISPTISHHHTSLSLEDRHTYYHIWAEIHMGNFILNPSPQHNEMTESAMPKPDLWMHPVVPLSHPSADGTFQDEIWRPEAIKQPTDVRPQD